MIEVGTTLHEIPSSCGAIGFSRRPRHAKCLASCEITRNSYDFFMDRSGLPDAH
jgi:hypothetical protein